MPCNVFGRPSLTRLFVRSVHNRSQSRHFRVSPFGSWSRLKPQPSPRQRSPESVSPLDWMEPGIGERRLPFPASPGRPPGGHSFVDTPAALRGGSGIRAQDTTRSGSLTRKCLNLLEDRPDQRWRAGRRSSKRVHDGEPLPEASLLAEPSLDSPRRCFPVRSAFHSCPKLALAVAVLPAAFDLADGWQAGRLSGLESGAPARSGCSVWQRTAAGWSTFEASMSGQGISPYPGGSPDCRRPVPERDHGGFGY